MASADPFDLQRFVSAQAPVYERALAELVAGRKRTHWMWFIFPQLRGLGRSAMAHSFGITGLDEAKAYLDHPALGPRLIACTTAVLNSEAASLNALLGAPDDLKFRSSMTLFDLADAGETGLFRQAIERWCGGLIDQETVALLDS